jgi:hypothetical protein
VPEAGRVGREGVERQRKNGDHKRGRPRAAAGSGGGGGGDGPGADRDPAKLEREIEERKEASRVALPPLQPPPTLSRRAPATPWSRWPPPAQRVYFRGGPGAGARSPRPPRAPRRAPLARTHARARMTRGRARRAAWPAHRPRNVAAPTPTQRVYSLSSRAGRQGLDHGWCATHTSLCGPQSAQARSRWQCGRRAARRRGRQAS